jgi:surface-anchored protein
MKPRFFKILIPAVIVGLSVFFTTNRPSPQPVDPSGPAASVRSQAHNHDQCDSHCRAEERASKLDETSPDGVLQRIPVADRASLWDGVAWNGQNPSGFLTKQIGDKVSMDLGFGEPMSGKVIVKNSSKDGSKVVGVEFSKPAATLHVRVDAKGSLFADLNPQDALSMYRWSGSVKEPVLTRLPQTSVICSSVEEGDRLVQGMPKASPGTTSPPARGPVRIPSLNSRPGARGCILLDLDGQVVTGTRWNTANRIATINSPAPSYSDAQISGIWRVMVEDFAPFNVTVTTSETVFNTYAKNRRMRVIFTPDQSWFSASVGGIAYLNSWSDGSDDPCWVFNMGENSAALTGSHEVGHTFGLVHDGLGAAEYYGTGNGAWGPIMGAPFGINVVQWSNGDYTGATNQEDDLALIAASRNGIGYITDDFGNTGATATNFGRNSLGGVVQSGLITTNTDVDFFSFTTTGGNIQLSLKSPSTSPNLNAQMTLLNSAGTELVTSNPAPSLASTITQFIPAGAYTVRVEGAAEGTFDAGGYSKYGSVGPYSITGTVPGLGAGIATITDPIPDGLSIREGNGLFLNATAPGLNASSTILWRQVSGPFGGVTTFYPATSLATRASFSKPGIYTIQVQLTSNGTISTDTVTVSVESITDPRNYANMGPVIEVSSATSFFTFDGDLIGAASDDGIPVPTTPKVRWDVVSGAATIESPASSGTKVRFLAPGVCTVVLSASDGQIRTFKEQVLNVSVRKIGVAQTGSPSKLLVPTNSSVDATWRDLAFNDAAWASRPLAIGYGNTTAFKADLVGGSNIRTQLLNKGTSTYTRVPFQIRSKDYVGGLKLQMKFDDGFVMYLNGTEILRNNVPVGAPAWNTVASSKRLATNVAVPIEVDLDSFKSLLLDGANVLAIHGVNFKRSDTEYLIAPNFEVQLIDTPYFRNVLEASALPTAVLAPNADADSDGTSNLVEHALGLNPFTANLPVPVLTPDGAGAVRMTLPLNPPSDVQYILERSYDMVTWTPIALKNGAEAWSSTVVTATTVSIATPLTTIRLLEASSPPSSVYRIRFVLSGPP